MNLVAFIAGVPWPIRLAAFLVAAVTVGCLVIRRLRHRVVELELDWNQEEQAVAPEPLPSRKTTYQSIYRSPFYLLTPTERDFYNVLRRAIPAGVSICMKVRLGDIVRCSEFNWRNGWGRKVAQKHIDFVLVNSLNSYILIAIELDDPSHSRQDRVERDEFVNDVLTGAGIGIVRVQVKPEYSAEEIADHLAELMPLVYQY